MRLKLLMLGVLAALSAGALDWDSTLIRGTTPGGRMFYEPGEEMSFSLVLEGMTNAVPADTYFLDWERRGDDGVVEKGRAPLPVKEPFVLRTKSDSPGFVCIEANVVTKDGKRVPKNHKWEKRVFFQGGAGVAPYAVKGGKEPADYEAFWQSVEKELAAVPVAAERREIPCADKAVRLYAVRIACAGPRPVTGYLTVPVAASAANRMPVLACYRGAATEEMPVPTGGPHDRIRMEINVNGYDLGRGEDYIKGFFKSIAKPGYGYGMDPESNVDRETSYWKGVAMRAIRHLQWLVTLPEWDGRTLEVSASSQGGWQAIMAASRFHKVTRLVTNGTWGCDWTGQDTLGRLKSTYRPKTDAPALAYYDLVFAARRVACPVAIEFAGLGDYVSPPSSLAALYSALPVPKKITYVQGETHGWRPGGDQTLTLDGGYDRAVKAQRVCPDPIAFITDALARGERRVTLPKAEYWLTPAFGQTAYLRLKGVKDAVIDFGGSKFVGTVKTRMLDLEDCARVTLKNLTIDYADLPFTQAVITKTDADGAWDVKVIDGYPIPDKGEKGDGGCWPIQVYGKGDWELKNPMRFRDGIEIAKTGVDTFRITGGQDRRGDVGDVAVWSVWEKSRPAQSVCIKSLRCSECRFEDITEYATPHGAAYEDYFGDANTYLRCRIVRCPPEEDLFPRGLKRLRSGNHDANMHRGAVRGPRILDCEAKYHCDDCVNISGMYGLVTESKGGDELRILVNYLGLSIDDGDTCQVMTYEGKSLPDVKVLKVTADGDTTEEEKAYMLTLGFWPGLEKSCRKAYRLKLERPLRLARGSVIISNRHQGNGFVVRGCDFGHTRARGLLIKASHGLIESNRIERCASLAMQIATEYQWMEGGCSRDVTVRGNECRQNGGGIHVGGNNGAGKPLPADSHYDISIIDNELNGAGIFVEGCTGGAVVGNGGAKVVLNNCEDVRRDEPAARVFGESGGIVRLLGLDAVVQPYAFNLSWGGGQPQRGLLPGKDGRHHWVLPPNGKAAPKVNGTLALEKAGARAARLEWTFTPEADMELAEMGVTVNLRCGDLKGGKVVLDGRELPLPSDPPARARIGYAMARTVRLVDAAGKVCAALTFDDPQGVLVQDNRVWGNENFSLRFAVPHEQPFVKGRTYVQAFVYEAACPFDLKRPDPVTVRAGADWIPLAPAGDIVPGSALDFSRIRGTDCPAGKYGRVVAKGATFEFENLPGVPQRFYGVNLCDEANTPPTCEEARRFAARLRKLGYNAVRFHHHESILVRNTGDPSGTVLNPEMQRRFDGLVAACVENGLYMTTDLYVSRRPIAWRAIGIAREGNLDTLAAKAYLLVHEGMQSNLFAFVRNWLGHVNPYTGRRLAEESALGWISLVNEAAQGEHVEYLSRQEPWVTAWKRWLREKKTRDPTRYGGIDEAFPVSADGSKGLKAQAYILFLQETESAFADRMKRFLREDLNCRALVTNLNGVWFPVAYQQCKEADYDFVDEHFYVDHPDFLERGWELPSRCPNVNPLANDSLGVQGVVHRRVLDRPFTCSEYNYSAPGRFRGVGGIATGALAALQGWSGLWRFAWSHDLTGVVSPERKALNYFDMSGDPLGLASERASICLFLRRDLPELDRTYAVNLPRALMRTPNPEFGKGTSTSFTWAGWYAKLGTQLGEKAPAGTVAAGTYPEIRTKPRGKVFADLGLAQTGDGDGFPRAAGGAVGVNRATGAFTIATPRTCGGFAECGVIETEAFTAELRDAPATVWASSLDGAPLAESSRILVTHLTDVQNSETAYADAELRVLLDWGRLPHLMRNGRAACRLRVADGDWTVYALNADGSHCFVVPSAVEKGRLSFEAKVDADPTAASYLYELVRNH